jgi:hypothetical protein
LQLFTKAKYENARITPELKILSKRTESSYLYKDKQYDYQVNKKTHIVGFYFLLFLNAIARNKPGFEYPDEMMAGI